MGFSMAIFDDAKSFGVYYRPSNIGVVLVLLVPH